MTCAYGIRADLRGCNEYFGFKPDLICFGKALGNGYPISALVGTDAFRDAVSSVFYTGTQFYNAAPMAAALATLKELERIDGAKKMLDIGKTILDQLDGPPTQWIVPRRMVSRFW